MRADRPCIVLFRICKCAAVAGRHLRPGDAPFPHPGGDRGKRGAADGRGSRSRGKVGHEPAPDDRSAQPGLWPGVAGLTFGPVWRRRARPPAFKGGRDRKREAGCSSGGVASAARLRIRARQFVEATQRRKADLHGAGLRAQGPGVHDAASDRAHVHCFCEHSFSPQLGRSSLLQTSFPRSRGAHRDGGHTSAGFSSGGRVAGAAHRAGGKLQSLDAIRLLDEGPAHGRASCGRRKWFRKGSRAPL
jgi:hypothetical protein